MCVVHIYWQLKQFFIDKYCDLWPQYFLKPKSVVNKDEQDNSRQLKLQNGNPCHTQIKTE